MKNSLALLTQNEIDQITQAVQNAEGVTSGEIVVCVIPKSDTYFMPPLQRLFAKQKMLHRVWQRAYQAFVDEEVFETKARTGILIFISLLERQVVVLGDSGINQKVTLKTWDDIVQKIINGIKSGQPAAGIISAVTQCGLLLKEHGFAKTGDDTNKRPDVIRLLKE